MVCRAKEVLQMPKYIDIQLLRSVASMIHYHGGPITPNEVAIKLWKARHAMISFAHLEQICLAAEVCQSFTLDNGAYSFWKVGKKPDWEKYKSWVDKWATHPGCDFFIIPDVINGTEKENNALISWWFTNRADSRIHQSVPVWHMHESLNRLESLFIYPRVAIGSSGEYATVGTQIWWKRMAEAMRVICDDEGKPRTKLHGLRMLNPTVFSHLPLSSADSTNVARNIGLDVRWEKNPYCPMTKATKALILAERIEAHASASFWSGYNQQENLSLIG